MLRRKTATVSSSDFTADDTQPARIDLRLLLYVNGASKPISIKLRQRIIVGRGSNWDTDVDLTAFHAEAYGVSRCHIAIGFTDGALSVQDLGSEQGTRLNGVPLNAQRIYRLRNGDELELGHLRLTIRLIHIGV